MMATYCNLNVGFNMLNALKQQEYILTELSLIIAGKADFVGNEMAGSLTNSCQCKSPTVQRLLE